MAAPIHPSLAVTLGIGAFIAWRMVSRVRRMVGRQRLSRVRPWISVLLFPLLVLLLLAVAWVLPTALLGLVAGVGAGAALGILGLRLTRFEVTPAGLFYTPNAYLGAALSVLLIARIAWRYAQIYAAQGPLDASPAEFGRSPLTLLIFGMLAGYYTVYSAGLLRWSRSAGPTLPASAGD